MALTITFALGCAPQRANVSPETGILAATKRRGKGAPYGRSDASQFFIRLTETAADPSYGLSADNPVKLGGDNLTQGPQRERAYLNGLRGPAGEVIEYERLGSCCPFETPNGILGRGFLDVFRVTYAGQQVPIKIYVNFYDKGPLLVPVGFTARRD